MHTTDRIMAVVRVTKGTRNSESMPTVVKVSGLTCIYPDTSCSLIKRMQLLGVVLLVTAQVCQVHSSLYSLQDTRPLLSTDGTPIQWWAGGGAYTLASAGAVRLNFRGIHVYPHTAQIRSLKEIGWSGVPCNTSAWALCSSDSGSVMPQPPPWMPEEQRGVPQGWEGLQCTDGTGKVLSSQEVYDISACDIMDEGLDVVYSQGALFHRYTSIQQWRYWTCVALAVILVRALSYNVQGVWLSSHKEDMLTTTTTHAQTPALVAAMTLLGLVLADLDTVYITTGDQAFFWCTVVYVGFYLGVHGGARAAEWAESKIIKDNPSKKQEQQAGRERPVFNIIVAALQMLAVRLYTAAETPYNLLLMGMLACRMWTKLLNPLSTRATSLVVDSLDLSLGVELAFTGTREVLVAVIGVAFLAARVLTVPRT